MEMAKKPKGREPRLQKRLTQDEMTVLSYLSMESMSFGRIAEMLDSKEESLGEILDGLEDRNLIVHRGTFGPLFGKYSLTYEGAELLGVPRINLTTKLVDDSVRPDEETRLMVFAQNASAVPVNNAVLRIVMPKFVTLERYNASFEDGSDRKVVDFPLSQLNPEETQSLNFKIRGALTVGAMASKYKIEVHAVVGDQVTDKREVEMTVEN